MRPGSFENKVAAGMSSDPEQQAARRLITEKIDSFEKLEIVVHVYRSGYTATSPAEIANATSMPADEVTKCMQALRSGACSIHRARGRRPSLRSPACMTTIASRC